MVGSTTPARSRRRGGSIRTASGPGPPSSNRQYGIRDYGAAVMYLPGKILYVGGGHTTNTAEIADINSGSPTWQLTNPMQFARRHLNATMLPTGEVLVTGGVSGTGFNDVTTTAIHAAEVWNPGTRGVDDPRQQREEPGLSRDVHPAARRTRPAYRQWRRRQRAGRDERRDLLATVPLQGTAADDLERAVHHRVRNPIHISTPDADAIDRISLIRIGSTTHAFDANQRFQWLSFTHGSGSLVRHGADRPERDASWVTTSSSSSTTTGCRP